MAVFSPTSEKDVTRAIVEGFAKQFNDYIESDVIIVGSGPSGLMAGRELAGMGFKTLIVERNNYLGGGFWLGGFLFNKLTARAPANKVFDELHVPSYEYVKGLYVADGPHITSALIKATCDAGAKFQNMTEFQDVVVREGNRISGIVMNWTPIHAMPRELTCVDPIAIESKVVIDATGHQAEVITKAHERGYIQIPGYQRLGIRSSVDAGAFNTFAGHDNPAHGSMWIEKSEDAIVEHTGRIHDGLYACGMAIATAFGLPRMGPTYGAMLLSGKRVAHEVAEELKGKKSSGGALTTGRAR
ncbi:MAG: sulfide-dependent adenosine diphosphate thiazole synthase [Methanobacteriota archaeon]